jgi:hypothetical protein
MASATFTATNRNNIRQVMNQSVDFLLLEDRKGFEVFQDLVSIGTEIEEDDNVYEVSNIYHSTEAGGFVAACRWSYDKNYDSAIEVNDFGTEG